MGVGAIAGGFTSVKPGGSAMAATLAAGSMVRFAVPDHLPGTQVLSLQVWKRAAISSVVSPARASGRVSITSAKDAEPSKVSVWLLKLGSNARFGARSDKGACAPPRRSVARVNDAGIPAGEDAA